MGGLFGGACCPPPLKLLGGLAPLAPFFLRLWRLVKCISQMSYEERLKHLGLPTLEYRGARADMVQVYKKINQIDKVDISKLFTFAPHGATRCHSLKLFKPRARLNVRQQSFSNRVIGSWNSLPESVVKAPSLNSFKSRLNNHWHSHSSKFTATSYLTHNDNRYRFDRSRFT